VEPAQQAIRIYFQKLGLELAVADIYIALHGYGPQTISELSRTAKVERTRIYRLIDQLMDSNLVEIETRHKRGIIKAAPIANVRILLNRREEALRNLQDELGLIEQSLARNSLSSGATRLQLYNGPAGIRQLLWKALSATTPLDWYRHRLLEEVTGRQFMVSWEQEFERQARHQRWLTQAGFVAAWQRTSATRATKRLPEQTTCRRLDTGLCRITTTILLYDDTCAYLQWGDGDIIGYELHDHIAAAMQRQLYEHLWQSSQPETLLS
jgi:hypothetical protein